MKRRNRSKIDYYLDYDLEHHLFNYQNITSDDYITPTFYEYVKMLEHKVEIMEEMKSDVLKEQSYWNSGEMQYHLLQKLLDKWEK